LNIKKTKTYNVALEIQVLVWDRHKNVRRELNLTNPGEIKSHFPNHDIYFDLEILNSSEIKCFVSQPSVFSFDL
jgi:hypothetical protein